jgi:hypothetical protein
MLITAGFAAFRATLLPPIRPLPERLATDGRTWWMILLVNSAPQGWRPKAQEMPSLFRFLTVVAVIVGIAYGVIYALANFVNPKPREMTVTIPPDKFLKK